MIIETKRSAFTPMIVDLETKVVASDTYYGGNIDFDAPNQMKETNQVLEVFVTTKATSAGEPTVQVVIESKAPGGSYAQIASGEVIALAGLAEGAVIYKAALPDATGQIVRIGLKNAVNATFTGGELVGFIRPL